MILTSVVSQAYETEWIMMGQWCPSPVYMWSRHLRAVNKSPWPWPLSSNWCVGDQGWWGIVVPNSHSSLATFPLLYPPAVPCDTFHMVQLLVMLCKSPDVKAENKLRLTTYLISFHYIFPQRFPLWQWKFLIFNACYIFNIYWKLCMAMTSERRAHS